MKCLPKVWTHPMNGKSGQMSSQSYMTKDRRCHSPASTPPMASHRSEERLTYMAQSCWATACVSRPILYQFPLPTGHSRFTGLTCSNSPLGLCTCCAFSRLGCFCQTTRPSREASPDSASRRPGPLLVHTHGTTRVLRLPSTAVHLL